jgi:hypothetical protein
MMPPDTALPDDASVFDVWAVRKSLETFRSGRDLHHSLACVASLGHIGLCGDVAEWLNSKPPPSATLWRLRPLLCFLQLLFPKSRLDRAVLAPNRLKA